MFFFKDRLKQISAFIFDVDGVLSTEKALITPNGELLRTANLKDGLAINVAVKQGYTLGIITGGYNEGVKMRYEELGVHEVYLKAGDKMMAFEKFIAKYKLSLANILYMGDDLPDLSVMKKVGVATCPLNAAVEIKAISHYISDKNGGEGAVRDVIEQTLRSQNKWSDRKNFVW